LFESVLLLTFVAALIVLASSEAIADEVGLVDPGQGMWHLYDEAGNETTSFFYGNPGDFPFVGDWDGDGVETPGLYRQSDGFVYIKNSNTQGNADITFFFGNPGDVPIAGDFNGDGLDTVSIYRPSSQTFFIINELGEDGGGLGAADISYVFGNPGDKPFVGDFDGDGVETVGLHRESTGLVYYRNEHTQGNADNQFLFGNPGDRLIAGDWTGDGVYTPALFRPASTTMFFKHTNTQGNADAQLTIGSGSWLPVGGDWTALTPVEWTISIDFHGEGVHSIFTIAEVRPMTPDAVDELFGRLVWDDQTVVDLCTVDIRDVGDGYIHIGDGYSPLEGCNPPAMQNAFDDFGLPDTACVGLSTFGGNYEYCAPLEVVGP
jgi:hypothetical protein